MQTLNKIRTQRHRQNTRKTKKRTCQPAQHEDSRPIKKQNIATQTIPNRNMTHPHKNNPNHIQRTKQKPKQKEIHKTHTPQHPEKTGNNRKNYKKRQKPEDTKLAAPTQSQITTQQKTQSAKQAKVTNQHTHSVRQIQTKRATAQLKKPGNNRTPTPNNINTLMHKISLREPKQNTIHKNTP